MSNLPPAGQAGSAFLPLSPAVQSIVRHLCEGDCHTFGDLIEWCESRGDCTIAVICPGCQTRFLVEEEELIELDRWTQRSGFELGCGVNYH
jgi:hypothetical protein